MCDEQVSKRARTESALERAARSLERDGYAVIEGLLDEEECALGRRLMWDFVEAASMQRVARDKPETHAVSRWINSSHRILQHFGVGQCDAVWLARRHPRVREVFAALYGVPADTGLTTSMDGMCLWPAPEHTMAAMPSSRWPEDRTWLHVDQDPRASGLHCVQGLVTYDTIDGQWDSTLRVLPGSHHLHRSGRIAEVLKLDSSKPGKVPTTLDFRMFTEEQLDAIYGAQVWRTQTVRVSAPRGSLVLWDSRCLHSNCAPVRGRPTPRTRYVVYVCLGPKAWCSDFERRRKRETVEKNKTTKHWPWQSSYFGEEPAHFRPGTTAKQPSRTDLTDPIVRSLCFFDPEDTIYPTPAGGLLDFVPHTPRR